MNRLLLSRLIDGGGGLYCLVSGMESTYLVSNTCTVESLTPGAGRTGPPIPAGHRTRPTELRNFTFASRVCSLSVDLSFSYLGSLPAARTWFLPQCDIPRSQYPFPNLTAVSSSFSLRCTLFRNASQDINVAAGVRGACKLGQRCSRLQQYFLHSGSIAT